MAQNTALLVMDMQEGIIGTFPDAAMLTANTAKAIAHARQQDIPVIYVVVGFRKGMPEISTGNKTFAASLQHTASFNPETFSKIVNELAPAATDVVVTKRRFSAFTGSDLEVLLRAKNIQHIVLAGFSTSGVVLSTLREASDKDYIITVLADACNDRDKEVHDLLLIKVFPRQADVVTVEEWTGDI